MSIYNPEYPTSSTDANLAGLYSNEAGRENPFLTSDDLSTTGLPFVVLIAPNGSKWKVAVANNGTLSTTAV